jgi:hypothetical protein
MPFKSNLIAKKPVITLDRDNGPILPERMPNSIDEYYSIHLSLYFAKSTTPVGQLIHPNDIYTW